MKNSNDSQLISSYIKGNENALALLLDRYKDRVYAFIYQRVNDRDLSEDIFQDTFLKVITTLKENRYKDEGKFINWCLRIAHNNIIDCYRNQRNKTHISDSSYESDEYSIWDFISSPENSAEETLVQKQIQKDLLKLIEYLPQDQKEIIDLRIFKGLSFKEISEEIDISINTALGRMRYALMNLRKLIQQHNIILAQ